MEGVFPLPRADAFAAAPCQPSIAAFDIHEAPCPTGGTSIERSLEDALACYGLPEQKAAIEPQVAGSSSDEPCAAGLWQPGEAIGYPPPVPSPARPPARQALALVHPTSTKRLPQEGAPLHEGRVGVATTLMILNVPTSASKQQLMSLIDSTGFAGRYDYLYLPSNYQSGTNHGRAFVNFVSPEVAEAFVALWCGAWLTGTDEHPCILKVVTSNFQGLEANTRAWTAARLRRVKNESLRPYIARHSQMS